MKKILVTACICLFVLGCRESVKIEDDNNVSVQAEDTLQMDLNKKSLDSISKIPIDKVLYPKNEGLPLYVLTTGIFHEDETSSGMQDKGWFGVFKDRGKYYITETTLNIRKAFDIIADEEENDSSKWTGWEVKTSHIDTSLVLIGGPSCLSSHEINHIRLDKDFIGANEKISFLYNNKSYTLSAIAEKVPSKHSTEEIYIHNYQLRLKGYKNGTEIDQLLAFASYLDDAVFRILFIGDIDDDGFPDLILDTTNHYNLFRPTVYLSSFADKEQLVRVVAIHKSVGC